MADTVADLLVDRLIDWEVDTVFSLPGDGINGIFEALRRRQDHIKLIQVRHEEAAADDPQGAGLALARAVGAVEAELAVVGGARLQLTRS